MSRCRLLARLKKRTYRFVRFNPFSYCIYDIQHSTYMFHSYLHQRWLAGCLANGVWTSNIENALILWQIFLILFIFIPLFDVQCSVCVHFSFFLCVFTVNSPELYYPYWPSTKVVTMLYTLYSCEWWMMKRCIWLDWSWFSVQIV